MLLEDWNPTPKFDQHTSLAVSLLPLSVFVLDVRYVGCYQDATGEDSAENSTDFSLLLWSRLDGTSASVCVSDCLQNGYQYAAMQNGTYCYCSNTFGRYGQVSYEQCQDKCTDRLRDYCGGPSTNAVYATSIG